ncbi:MAG: hypothetical protein K6V97_03785 [Actinomycetia bacterium]|nr:hypothetical protein [Actinomycetes bacterium]
MPTNLYQVSPGNPASAQDLNQVLAALSGQNDIGIAACYQPLANPPALTATVSSASGPLNGAYAYVVVYRTGWLDGDQQIHYSGNQTAAGQPSNEVNPAGNAVSLTNIPLGPAGVVARDIYRTTAGGTTYYYLTTLADNVTTEYTDTTADSSLGTQTAPTVNTTGTVLQLPVFPAVPGFTAPAGVIIAVQPSGQPVTLYQSTGSGWVQIPDLATANTWQQGQTMPTLTLEAQSSAVPSAGTLSVVDGQLWIGTGSVGVPVGSNPLTNPISFFWY